MKKAVPPLVVGLGVVSAVLSFWLHGVFRPMEFADLGVEALKSGESQAVIVDAVVDAIAEEGSDARALLEPLATRALAALLDAPIVEAALVAVAEGLYDSLLSDEPSDVVLLARALIDPIADGVAVFNAELADEMRQVDARISLIDGESIPSFSRVVSVVAWQRWVGLALAAAAALAAWAFGGRLGETLGVGTAAGGALALVTVPIARGPVLGLFTDERAEVLAGEAYVVATRSLLVLAATVVVFGLVVWGADRVMIARNTQ
ncbi:MAG: hypothetical protein HKO87_07300 [Acidimicrobiia bacterium]|nr:hypothetical protein [Acidimicrobiia bacterium]